MFLLAVDPGIRACGVAIFDGTELQAAAWVRSDSEADGVEAWVEMAEAAIAYAKPYFECGPLVYVAEIPQIYQAHHARTDQNDLPPLAGVCAAIGALLPQALGKGGDGTYDLTYVSYTPHQWKKNVPKPIMLARTKARLSADELARCVLPKGRKKDTGVAEHNVFDACALGLHYLKERKLRWTEKINEPDPE